MPETEIVLYQYGGDDRVPSLSPPCLKVLLALRRLGLRHHVVNVSPLRVRRVSPSGRLPALRLGSEIVVDSCSILDALERIHPEADLWPRDPQQRVVDRLWDHFATDTLYWGGVYQRYLVPGNREAAWDLFFGKGFSWRRVLLAPLIVREVRSRARGHGIGRRSPDDVRRAYAEWLGMVDSALAQGPFFQGRETPGRGDLSVASHVAQLARARETGGIATLLERLPRLLPHVARVFEACSTPPP